MLRSIWVAVLLLILIVFSSLAFSQSVVSLFDLGLGVRPLGMGGTFTGLADDLNALFYNPAGLATLERMALSSFYTSHLGAASLLAATLAGRNFGLGALLFSLGGIEGRDESDRPTQSFAYSQFAIVGAYGLQLHKIPLPFLQAWEKISVSLRARFYQVNTLEGGNGSGFTLDPALMFNWGKMQLGPLALDDLRLGVLMENLLSLGIGYKSGHRESWRLNLRLGSSVKLKYLLLAMDLESIGVFHLGSEFKLSGLAVRGLKLEGLALRAGIFWKGGEGEGGGLAPTAGLGLILGNFQLDYAFIAYAQLPATHRLAVTIKF